jgi:hypothetical protein
VARSVDAIVRSAPAAKSGKVALGLDRRDGLDRNTAIECPDVCREAIRKFIFQGQAPWIVVVLGFQDEPGTVPGATNVLVPWSMLGELSRNVHGCFGSDRVGYAVACKNDSVHEP